MQFRRVQISLMLFCFALACSDSQAEENCEPSALKSIYKNASKLNALSATRWIEKDQIDQSCRQMNGTLPAFWAQELVGSVFVRDLLKQLAPRMQKVNFALGESMDLSHYYKNKLSPGMFKLAECLRSEGSSSTCSQDVFVREYVRQFKNEKNALSHGSQVGNLIIDDFPVGLNSNATLACMRITSQDDSNRGDTNWDLLFQCMKDHNVALYADSTYSFQKGSEDKKNYKQMSSAIEHGLIFVVAIGNHTDDMGISPEKSILVTSLSPLGILSNSAMPERAFIAAPADFFLNAGSCDKLFGHSSGAQPLVSSVVLRIKGLLPDATINEVKTILLKTALPTKPTPTLNAYRAIRLAAELQENWKESRKRIERYSMEKFASEADDLYKEARLLFHSKRKEDREKVKLLLQKSFLLDPDPEKARTALAKLHKERGERPLSFFYSALQGISVGFLQDVLATYGNDPQYMSAVAKEVWRRPDLRSNENLIAKLSDLIRKHREDENSMYWLIESYCKRDWIENLCAASGVKR